uniref:CRC domain-containing protein n=1 Tax=Macrostomum lignano TaxID=282301 RepID=A0A1I8IDZ3_9PLAT
PHNGCHYQQQLSYSLMPHHQNLLPPGDYEVASRGFRTRGQRGRDPFGSAAGAQHFRYCKNSQSKNFQTAAERFMTLPSGCPAARSRSPACNCILEEEYPGCHHEHIPLTACRQPQSPYSGIGGGGGGAFSSGRFTPSTISAASSSGQQPSHQLPGFNSPLTLLGEPRFGDISLGGGHSADYRSLSRGSVLSPIAGSRAATPQSFTNGDKPKSAAISRQFASSQRQRHKRRHQAVGLDRGAHILRSGRCAAVQQAALDKQRPALLQHLAKAGRPPVRVRVEQHQHQAAVEQAGRPDKQAREPAVAGTGHEVGVLCHGAGVAGRHDGEVVVQQPEGQAAVAEPVGGAGHNADPVAAAAAAASAEYLNRQVEGAQAGRQAALGAAVAQGQRVAEVAQADVTASSDQHVVGLHVQVEEAAGVQEVDGAAELGQVEGGLPLHQHAAGLGQAADQVLKGAAGRQFEQQAAELGAGVRQLNTLSSVCPACSLRCTWLSFRCVDNRCVHFKARGSKHRLASDGEWRWRCCTKQKYTWPKLPRPRLCAGLYTTWPPVGANGGGASAAGGAAPIPVRMAAAVSFCWCCACCTGSGTDSKNVGGTHGQTGCLAQRFISSASRSETPRRSGQAWADDGPRTPWRRALTRPPRQAAAAAATAAAATAEFWTQLTPLFPSPTTPLVWGDATTAAAAAAAATAAAAALVPPWWHIGEAAAGTAMAKSDSSPRPESLLTAADQRRRVAAAAARRVVGKDGIGPALKLRVCAVRAVTHNRNLAVKAPASTRNRTASTASFPAATRHQLRFNRQASGSPAEFSSGRRSDSPRARSWARSASARQSSRQRVNVSRRTASAVRPSRRPSHRPGMPQPAGNASGTPIGSARAMSGAQFLADANVHGDGQAERNLRPMAEGLEQNALSTQLRVGDEPGHQSGNLEAPFLQRDQRNPSQAQPDKTGPAGQRLPAEARPGVRVDAGHEHVGQQQAEHEAQRGSLAESGGPIAEAVPEDQRVLRSRVEDVAQHGAEHWRQHQADGLQQELQQGGEHCWPGQLPQLAQLKPQIRRVLSLNFARKKKRDLELQADVHRLSNPRFSRLLQDAGFDPLDQSEEQLLTQIGDQQFGFFYPTCKFVNVQVREMKELEVQVREMKELEVQVREMKELEVQVREMKELKEEVQVREMKELEVQVREMKELEVQVREMKELEVQRPSPFASGWTRQALRADNSNWGAILVDPGLVDIRVRRLSELTAILRQHLLTAPIQSDKPATSASGRRRPASGLWSLCPCQHDPILLTKAGCGRCCRSCCGVDSG